MKIKDGMNRLKKQEEEANARIEKINAEIEKLQEEAEKLRNVLENEDDPAAYEIAFRKHNDISEKIKAREAFKKKLDCGIKTSDVVNVWEEGRKEYEAALAKKLRDLDDKRQAFYKAYLSLIEEEKAIMNARLELSGILVNKLGATGTNLEKPNKVPNYVRGNSCFAGLADNDSILALTMYLNMRA